MKNRLRMQRALAGNLDIDRLPAIEWASWWDQTLSRWQRETPGCPGGQRALFDYFELDPYDAHWIQLRGPQMPTAATHGAPLFDGSAGDYWHKIRPHLFGDALLPALRHSLLRSRDAHAKGDIFVWYTLEGFFWFPRTLFGIENHLYAFYDAPELMHEINDALTRFHLRALEVIYDVLTPEFMTFAEDMSYNHGPMISKASFDEMLLPYYRRIIPQIQAQGTHVLIDTDGNVEPLIPWFAAAGADGVLPLERQSAVDVNRVRANHPGWLMIGGFDKRVLHLGEDAIRAEFERVLPAMRSGRYIPSVDHQTPPDVSVDQYRSYVGLLKEYARRAVT